MRTVKAAILASAIALVSVGAPAVAATPEGTARADDITVFAPCGTSHHNVDHMTYKNCATGAQYIRPRNRVTGAWHGQCQTLSKNEEYTWWVWQPSHEWYGAHYSPTSQCV